jgi:hypothetical protein
MYQLTEDDLDYSPDQNTPLIRAAAKRDSALLEALLVCYAASSAENTTERERQQVMAAPSLAAMRKCGQRVDQTFWGEGRSEREI